LLLFTETPLFVTPVIRCNWNLFFSSLFSISSLLLGYLLLFDSSYYGLHQDKLFWRSFFFLFSPLLPPLGPPGSQYSGLNRANLPTPSGKWHPDHLSPTWNPPFPCSLFALFFLHGSLTEIPSPLSFFLDRIVSGFAGHPLLFPPFAPRNVRASQHYTFLPVSSSVTFFPLH